MPFFGSFHEKIVVENMIFQQAGFNLPFTVLCDSWKHSKRQRPSASWIPNRGEGMDFHGECVLHASKRIQKSWL